MEYVISKDGTRIAFDFSGQGPALILVTGALGARSDPMSHDLVSRLAQHNTAYNYDRRGRGDSGDTLPYAVEREIEDIDAVIERAGGSAYLYGISSGAVLALEAANKLPGKVTKLALYEPPFILDDSRPPIPADYVEQINTAVTEGRRGDAVEIFMTKAILIPAEFVAMMRNAPPAEIFEFKEDVKPPDWSEMEKVAHTLAYDGEIVQDVAAGKPWTPDRWASTRATTLVITGENSEPFFHNGAKALVNELSNAQHRLLEGQDHAVSPAALAPVLVEFFAH